MTDRQDHPVHRIISEVVDTYLKAADTAAPGLIEGLYLEGSAALDDFRPHTSDIDFVAVTAEPLDASGLAALARVHAGLPRRPHFDGVYLTWTDLARGPGPVPHAHEGRLHPAGPTAHNPITWHTLARYGIACRGPHPGTLAIWADPHALTSWTDGNLDTYWRPWLTRAANLRSAFGLYTLTPAATVWVVTGVTRLHYTLATLDITSKTDAAHYALTTFPTRWHRLLHETLRIRRRDPARPGYRSPFRRRRDALEFAALVIDDAHRLHSGRSG
ncbi:MAG TPA: aminoglycoside adenylyltransferase domain-containing protein [Actinophytocola sp.]|uniref:nucleotidyltransferase domain-containing protein n=1 Tax=Actinophytocola sp. TaxID=1872138 RepID=UPI002DFDCBEC|nr:aminoglycoside adenylyltransferase domain-containing protein [Actinophytocola sp.]